MSTNRYGQATGYDQFAPGRDVPNQSRTQRSPLQSAIAGPPQPQAAPTNYPADPSMQQWRSRQPGPAPRIQPQNPMFDPSQGGIPPLQAAGAPSSYRAGAPPPELQAAISNYIHQNNLHANQSDPSSLFDIVKNTRNQGFDGLQVDYTDENGHTGGLRYNGSPYQLIDGNNNWTDLRPWEQAAPKQPHPLMALSSAIGGGRNPNSQPSFNQTLLMQLLQQANAV